MFYAVFSLIVLLFIMPIAIKAKTVVSFNDKKLYYSLFLYERLRLNSGYIKLKSSYLVINYSDKKAKATKIKTLIQNKNFKSNFIRFEPLKIKSALFLGKKNFNAFFFSTALNAVHASVYSIFKELKPHSVYKGNVFIGDNDEYGFLFELKVGFCILILVEMAVIKLIGGIVSYAKRKFGQ